MSQEDLQWNISVICITVLHYHNIALSQFCCVVLSHFCLILQNRKISKSLYRKIVVSQNRKYRCFNLAVVKLQNCSIAKSKNRSNAKSQNCSVFFVQFCEMRYAISHIGDFSRFSNVIFQLMHAMRWRSHHNIAIYHFTHKETSYNSLRNVMFLKE